MRTKVPKKKVLKDMKTLLDYIEQYNKKIFPMQLITLAVAVILVYLLFTQPSATTTLLMRAYLAFIFCWVGVSHLIMFKARALIITVPNFALAGIFLLDIFTMETVFALPQAAWQIYASLLLMVWGWVIFPLTGWVIGHRYPRVPLFGAVNCPTNIFAIGLLTAVASNRLEEIALLILSLLAIVIWIRVVIKGGYDGGRIDEDLALLPASIYGLVVYFVIF